MVTLAYNASNVGVTAEVGGTFVFVSLCRGFDSNLFEAILFLVTKALLSSGYAVIAPCLSCASGFILANRSQAKWA